MPVRGFLWKCTYFHWRAGPITKVAVSGKHRASPVAQTVKNPPTTRETWVGKTSPHPQRRERQPTPVCAWEFHGQRGLAGCSPRGDSPTRLSALLKLHWLGQTWSRVAQWVQSWLDSNHLFVFASLNHFHKPSVSSLAAPHFCSQRINV